MSLTPGTKLGPYEILAPIGEGGMGEVWKARDTRLDRTIALKVTKAEFTERFEREARAVAALNHPHICQLYDVGPNYLVMELIDGAPLKGPLPLDQAMEYAAQILDALDAAHKKGIVHRDLKPANILVTRQGIKLLDFGLAKQAAPLQESDATITKALTGSGQILGTLQYMAPEQLQGLDATPSSDLFSFGCVFYEMLTGVCAFEGANAASVITSVMSAQPAPLDAASLPPAMERLLRICLAKNPVDRWQSASDLRRELRWAAASKATAAVVAPRARYGWIAVATAVAGLAIGAGVMWGLRKPQAQAPVRLSIVPPENGNVTAFSISPDEASLAFPVLKDGKTQIWLRRLDSETAERVAGTEGANDSEVPAWSPDGEQLAFAAGETLKLVSLRGGKVKDLTRGRNRGIAWSADGTILFVDFAQSICRIPVGGGKVEKLTGLDLDGFAGARFPEFLPDGNRFLYVSRGTVLGTGTSVVAGSLDGKTRKRILANQPTAASLVVEPGGSAGWLVWVRDDSLVVQRWNPKSLELEGKAVTIADNIGFPRGGTGRAFFAASNRAIAYREPESRLVRLVAYDAGGKRLREVIGPGPFVSQLRVSPDGRQALGGAYDRETRSRHIQSIDLASGAVTRRTFEGAVDDPLWSKDGKTIFFLRQEEPAKTQVYQSPADWSAPPQLLTEVPGSVRLWDADADQKTLLLFTDLASARTLTRGPSGWELHEVLNGEPFRKGKFSPDGHWVIYQAAGTGLYATAWPPTGAKWQISPDGAEPAWRRDGKEVYFLRGDEMTAVSVDTSDRSVKVGPPQALFRAPVPVMTIPGQRFDVSADGKTFLVWEQMPDPPGVPFTVLLNWKSLVDRQ